MEEVVWITGFGIITSIGDNAQENLHSLKEQRSGLGFTRHIDTIYKELLPVGEIRFSQEELLELCNLSSPEKISRTALLGIIAIREALASAGLPLLNPDAGLISATTAGGMSITEERYMDIINPEKKGDILSYIQNIDCGGCTQQIADHLGFRGLMTTISTACSSSANAIAYGARLIRHGYLERAVCGGTDALTKFTINGFNALKNLDREFCRPFDENRNGLNLGEGAAFLVLESPTAARLRGVQPLAVLSGYCNTNEAFHPTAPSPEGEGALAAMQGAISLAGLAVTDIDYVNVHGTATWNNDLSEGVAMQKLFGEQVPPFSSTKPYTGHTLGAAGAVEAVFSLLSLKNGLIYPNLNFREPMKELRIQPETALLQERDIRHVLSNSFGFGGNNTSLVLSKPDHK